MSTIHTAPQAVAKKLITLSEWDEGTNQQRTFWLENGYVLSAEEGRMLTERNKAETEEYRRSNKGDMRP